MKDLMILIPFGAVLISLLILVLRALMKAWVAHRVRIEVLQSLERHPELLTSMDDVQTLLEENETETDLPPAFQEFLATGIFLVLLGLSCLPIGGALRNEEWAVGMHWGGLGSIFLGIMLVLAGIFIRLLSKPLTPK